MRYRKSLFAAKAPRMKSVGGLPFPLSAVIPLIIALATAYSQPIRVDFVQQVTGHIVDLAVGGRGQVYFLDAEGTVTVMEPSGKQRTLVLLANVNRRFSFGTAKAIAVDRGGNIFICDESKDIVAKFTQSGQYVSHFGPAASHSEALKHPLDLAIDRFSRVFVVDGERVVHVFNNQGVYVGRLTGFNQPVDIGSDRAGNIYVLESKEPSVYVYDLNLELLGQRALGAGGELGLAVPEGIFVEPDGTVYVTDPSTCLVVALSSFLPSDAPLMCYTRIGVKGEGRGEFRDPTAVAVDGSGRLYVADERNRNVQIFALSGLSELKRELAPPPLQPLPVTIEWRGDIHHAHNPGSVGLESFAVDTDGTVYCADAEAHSIAVYDKGGRFVMAFGSEGKDPGRMKHPRGIAVAGEKDLFVLDAGNHRIQHWSKTGVFQRQFGAKGKNPSEFNNPSCLTLDPRGSLVVADKDNDRIQIIGTEGELKSAIATIGDERLRKPTNIAVDAESTLYVLQEDRPWITIANLRDGTVRSIGDENHSPFVEPQGVAVDSLGTLFVLDGQTGVYAFHDGSRLMAHFASLGDLVGQFRRPTAIRIAPTGDILVADAAHNKISVFRLGNVVEGAVAGRVHPVPPSGIVTITKNNTAVAQDSLLYDGSYQVCDVPPGDVVVVIDAPGFTQSGAVSARATAGGIIQCELIDLEADGSITGLIVPSAPQAVVTLIKGREPVAETSPDPMAGAYQFPDLRPGEYAITVSAPGFVGVPIPKKIVIESGLVLSDTTYLKRPGAVGGLVTPPEAGAMGIVLFDTVTTARFAVRSDNGLFETPELYPDMYTVVLSADGFVDLVVPDIEIREGEHLDLGVLELERVKTTTAEAFRLLSEAKMLHLAADFEGAQTILDSVIATEEMAEPDLAEAYLWLAYSYFPFSELKNKEMAILHEALTLNPAITVDGSFSPAFLQDFEAVRDSLSRRELDD